MSTGGFRDISTLSTGRRPRSMTMSDHDEEDMRDVEMNAATALLEEDDHYFEDEKPEMNRSTSRSSAVGSMTGVKPLIITTASTQKPPRKLKSILKSLKADRTVVLSRPRVVFRMFSLVTSGVVLGASGHILYHFIDTREFRSPPDVGPYIWNRRIRLTPTNLLLAVSTYVFLLDLVFSVASFWPRGRYLKSRLVASLALLHSVISLTAGIIVLIFSEEKRNPDSMFWVCTVKNQSAADLAVMDFSTHCTELRSTWVAACIYTVAHGLIIPTIVLGFISCGTRKRPTFQDAIIIEDTGRGGVFQRLGELKGKFTRNK